MKKRNRQIAYRVGAVLFWLAVWQIAAVLVNRTLLIPIPTPLRTAAALGRLAAEGSFWLTVGASILRILIGFAAALAAGIVCALLAVRFSWFRILTAPLVQVIRAVPVASFTILIFLWVSRGKIPTVIVFFTVFPIIWANVESGLLASDASLREMATVFGMPRARQFREITLPLLRPHLLSAAASGLGFAWKSGVAAEVICRTGNSLGDLLWRGKTAIDYDEVFAVTLVIVILSVALQAAAQRLIGKRGGMRPSVSVRAAAEPAERSRA